MSDDKSIPTSWGLLLFPGFEVLDAAGPIELLNTLSFHLHHHDLQLSVIGPSTSNLSPAPVNAEASTIKVVGQQFYQPTHSFDNAPDLDVLIVPGGRGTTRSDEELRDLLDFLRKCFFGTGGRRQLKYIFSICTGSDLLARAGILDDRRATTNKKAWGRVTPHGKKTHWVANARWVVSGRVISSSGVAAGMDGMAALLAKIYGEELADKVCNHIEYPRAKDPNNDPFAEMNGCKDVLPVKE